MPVVNQPEVMIGNAAQRFDRDGKLTDEPTRKSIQKLLSALLHLCTGQPGMPVPRQLRTDGPVDRVQ